MDDLTTIVSRQLAELDTKRFTNMVKDIPLETQKAHLKHEILNWDYISRWINSMEELEGLADRIFKLLVVNENTTIGGLVVSSYPIFNVGESLVLDYGVPIEEKDLKQGEFAHFADFSDIDADKPQYELRNLSGNPSTNEILGRSMSLYKRKGKPRYLQIPPGFVDWRTALEFAKDDNMWTLPRGRRVDNNLMAFKNSRRYQRFGLGYFEAVRAFRPGALYHVENVFGEFAAKYVNGSIERFRELLILSQINDAKRLFQEECQSDYERFKERVA